MIAFFNQKITQVNNARPIKNKPLFGCPSRWANASNDGVIFVPFKVFRPCIRSWIVECRHQACCRIYGVGCGELVNITALARKSKIEKFR